MLFNLKYTIENQMPVRMKRKTFLTSSEKPNRILDFKLWVSFLRGGRVPDAESHT